MIVYVEVDLVFNTIVIYVMFCNGLFLIVDGSVFLCELVEEEPTSIRLVRFTKGVELTEFVFDFIGLFIVGYVICEQVDVNLDDVALQK